LGPMHNLGAIAQVKQPITVEGYTTKAQPIYRLYFDGLAIHFHTSADDIAVDGLRPMLVGPDEGTTLSMVTWEASWQALNISYVIADAEHEFPGGIARAEGRRSGPNC
jgi:hypothetical protein